MEDVSRRALTPTSYAILGLLNLRAWTGYELARQMGRSLGYIWPRAVSALYAEPRNLVAHELAAASHERTGRRPRTVYSITEAGRRSLAAWMATPSAPPQFESEALVRISFPEGASKEVLLQNLADFRRQAEELERRLALQVSGYFEAEGGPFPDRLHVIALDGRFVYEYVQALLRWSHWAEREVEAWPSIDSPDLQSARATLQDIATRLSAKDGR